MIDLLSSAPHYRAHSLPAWDRLPDVLRGDRIDIDKPGPQFSGLRTPRRGRGDAVLVASFRDMGYAWSRGYRRIALLEHGYGQTYVGVDHGAYPGGAGRELVSLFLSPNEAAAAKDRARYPTARVEVVGDPRLDTLPQWVPDGRSTVAISWHWESSAVPEMRSALKHYRAVLPDLSRRFNLIGHCHPRAVNTAAPLYRRLGIEFVRDFDEVCRRADVYACDTSSTIFEFASTGRPVVLLNAPWYRRPVEQGGRFWAAAGVGGQVDEPGDLGDVIELALINGRLQSEARARALELVYAGWPERSPSTAAAEVLVDWLGEQWAVA